jgi:hypothetical protein
MKQKQTKPTNREVIEGWIANEIASYSPKEQTNLSDLKPKNKFIRTKVNANDLKHEGIIDLLNIVRSIALYDMDQDAWEIFQNNEEPVFALTGSMSLKILGLLDREVGDIDVVVYCNNEKQTTSVIESIKEWKKVFQIANFDKDLEYHDDRDAEDYNLEQVWLSGVKIDIFIQNKKHDDSLTIDLADFKITRPKETFYYKNKFTPEKAEKDLQHIINLCKQ